MGLIAALIVGGIAGWLAGIIVKGSGHGVLMNVVIGIIGGFRLGRQRTQSLRFDRGCHRGRGRTVMDRQQDQDLRLPGIGGAQALQ